MTATVTGGTTATRSPAPAPRTPGRRRLRLPRASTTPGQVRLIRAGLVVLCPGWGALAGLMVGQHASAAGGATSTSEPLSLDAQQMYQSLADADVTVSTGYLFGRVPPPVDRQRYQQDIAVATADLKAVTAASGASPGIGGSLSTLSSALPVYTGYVQDNQIYSSLGLPAGGSYVEVASEEMHQTLLPAARDANAWFAVNQRAQRLDAAHQYADETNLVIGTAGTLFGHLEDDLGAVIHADQAVFAASAAAGSGAFSGLQIGIVVLALAMAAGCAWGLSQRLAEYR